MNPSEIFSKNGIPLDGEHLVMWPTRTGIKKGVLIKLTPQGDCYIKDKKSKAYWAKPEKVNVLKQNFGIDDFISDDAEDGVGGSNQREIIKNTISASERFNINERFDFLEIAVRMTVRNELVSLIVVGDGGLGKTFTVRQAISEINPEIFGDGSENNEYLHWIKGYSTAKGLYNTLFENNGKLIIFDDCDEVLKNDTARNILKGALDSYDVRKINWISNTFSEEIPAEFEFDGRIIFISNMPRHKIPQPIISRAAFIDVAMTVEDKLARMENLLPVLGDPKMPLKDKEKALEIVKKHAYQTSDLNFRTIIKAMSVLKAAKHEDSDKVEGLAEYLIMN